MGEKGKAMEVSNGNNFFSDYICSSSDIPCKKHPNSSSVGICAYCLKDKLMKLVCSQCGEQRLSSCSCSDVSPYRYSCSTVEVGSVGRISFLIESERMDDHPSNLKPKRGVKERLNDDIILKRSSSTCVEAKKSIGFWKIGKMFKKYRGKQSGDGFDEKGVIFAGDSKGVSRSRSLCSFRKIAFSDPPDQESNEFAFSSAKVSDVNGAEQNESGIAKNGIDLDQLRCDFPVKESDFSGINGSEYIDLNLDFSSNSKTEYSAFKINVLKEDRVFGHGRSCRITVKEKKVKKGSTGPKIWRWILSHQHILMVGEVQAKKMKTKC